MRRRNNEPSRFCLTCGYALHGLSEPRCPECGSVFDPRNPKTFARAHAKPGEAFWPWVVPVAACIAASLCHGLCIALLIRAMYPRMTGSLLALLALVFALPAVALLIAAGRRSKCSGTDGSLRAWGHHVWDSIEVSALVGGAVAAGSAWLLGLSASAAVLIALCLLLSVFWVLLVLLAPGAKD